MMICKFDTLFIDEALTPRQKKNPKYNHANIGERSLESNRITKCKIVFQELKDYLITLPMPNKPLSKTQ